MDAQEATGAGGSSVEEQNGASSLEEVSLSENEEILELEEDAALSSDNESESASTSSEASGDYEDEKRHAAEIFKNCFLRVAQKSAAQAKGEKNTKVQHALSDWWKAGAIAGSKRKKAPLDEDGSGEKDGGELDIKFGSDLEEDSENEDLKWVAETTVRAKGISESLEEIRNASHSKLTKKLEEKRKDSMLNRWAPTPKPIKAARPVHWIDTPSAKMTEEVKRDLAILKMRDTLDPTRFYKKLDMKKDPKWLQIGTVVDNPYDGRYGRLPNRLRKKTIAEQWLADPEVTAMRTKRIQSLKETAMAERKVLFENQPYLRKHRKKLRR
ncbi:hypothetical protein BSKO_07806 [Bryopsis sp. KO-2023]|nr:hypothetical protein BSKO_07806 [Bryopsis sp. KO-2023]